MPVDDQWIRSVVVAKQLLDQAKALTTQPDSGAIAAVLLADLAVETTAKAAVQARPPADAVAALNPNKDPSLAVVLKALLKSWQEAEGDDTLASPEIKEAHQLRRYRNLIQHDGEIPTDPGRQVARGEAFVRWAARQVFGVELEEISRAYLVQDEAVRARIRLAEDAAEQDQYVLAMAQLRVALSWALDTRSPWESFTFIDVDIQRGVERATGAELWAMGQQKVSVAELIEVLKKMAKRLMEVDDVVQAIAVGADPVEFAWFMRTAPETRARFNTPVRTFMDDGEPRSRDDYIRAYDFVLTTLLRWQQLPPREDRSAWARSVPHTEVMLPEPPASEE